MDYEILFIIKVSNSEKYEIRIFINHLEEKWDGMQKYPAISQQLWHPATMRGIRRNRHNNYLKFRKKLLTKHK